MEYAYKMKKIAKKGNIEEAALLYIIKGIPDDNNNKIILYEANTFEALKTKLETYIRIKNYTSENKPMVKKILTMKSSEVITNQNIRKEDVIIVGKKNTKNQSVQKE